MDIPYYKSFCIFQFVSVFWLAGCTDPQPELQKHVGLPALRGLYEGYSTDSLINAEVRIVLKENIDSFLTLRKLNQPYIELEIFSNPCFDAEHKIVMANYIHPYKLHFFLIVRELTSDVEFQRLAGELIYYGDTCATIQEYYNNTYNDMMSDMADKSWVFYKHIADTVNDVGKILPHINPVYNTR